MDSTCASGTKAFRFEQLLIGERFYNCRNAMEYIYIYTTIVEIVLYRKETCSYATLKYSCRIFKI